MAMDAASERAKIFDIKYLRYLNANLRIFLNYLIKHERILIIPGKFPVTPGRNPGQGLAVVFGSLICSSDS
jgi:hypothetical protein